MSVPGREEAMTVAVDECGEARISLVTALFDLPNVKVFEIATADRYPLAQQCWGSDFGDRVCIAASKNELDRAKPLTSVTFGGSKTDWQVHIGPGKFVVMVFMLRIPEDGVDGRVLWRPAFKATAS